MNYLIGLSIYIGVFSFVLLVGEYLRKSPWRYKVVGHSMRWSDGHKTLGYYRFYLCARWAATWHNEWVCEGYGAATIYTRRRRGEIHREGAAPALPVEGPGGSANEGGSGAVGR